MDLEALVDDFFAESAADYVGLWEIAQSAREDLGAKTTEEALRVSLEIVQRLYEKGLRPGEYWGGPFDYWPEEGCAAMLDRIAREWTALGGDPNLGDPICWFGPEPTPAILEKNTEWNRQYRRMEELMGDYLRAAQIGYIGLPQIASDVRTELRAQTVRGVRQWCLLIVRWFYYQGLRPGGYEGGSFNYWPDKGCAAMLGRIEREWIAAGEDPSAAHPICWFARMPQATPA